MNIDISSKKLIEVIEQEIKESREFKRKNPQDKSFYDGEISAYEHVVRLLEAE